jgi:hypothetical protein
MNAFAFLFKKFSKRAVGRGGFQQFDFAFSDLKEGGGDALAIDPFGFIRGRS